MNRKLVNGLLLLSCATVGCGTFTSCKDTDEDFKNEVLISQDEYYKKLIEYIDTNINSCECPEDTKALLAAIREFLGASVDGKYPDKAVETKINGLIDGALNRAFGENYKSWLNQTNLSNLVHSNDPKYVEMGNDIVALNQFMSEQKETNKEIEANVEAALARANEAYMSALEANNILTDLVPAVETALAELKAALDELQPQIDAINERLNSLITSIITQQTYNPIFGTLNLPIGLQSNVVANYYGYTENSITFPFGAGATEYNGNNSVLNNDAVAAAIAQLGYTTKTVSGYYMSDDVQNNLGNLYVTINPNNINFNGVKLSLVNSKDEVAPVELNTVKENDKVLDFGFDLTRSAENNGFYRSEANVDPAKAPELAVRIESGLKSAMKDALLDHTKQDFVALGKVLFNQMNGILPAYALKAEWEAPVNVKDAEGKNTTETQKFAVYSNYNIAAATVHPLGYEFLYGEGTSKELPTFGRLQDKLHEFFNDIRKDISFNLNLGIDEEKYKINLDLSKIDFKVGVDKLTVIIPSMPIYKEGSETEIIGYTKETPIELTYTDGTVSGNDGALNGLVDAINNAVKDMLTGTDNSIQSVINNEVVTKMNALIADINEQLSGINGDINQQIGTILDKIENQLAGKLDGVQGLVDKYNALANKINNFLKNPNSYLQVMMAYETKNDGLHQLSNSYNDPSYFNQAGGNSIELFATSYTAELVAPSYLKFVAVTRAWNVNTKTEAPAVAKDVNTASEHLNVVRPGRQQRFGLTGLKSGYKYEIVYTSLDYRGYTSTNLYYLTVK